MKKATRIQCDASQAGLGGRPVEYASRALTPTEQRYAQIEKEQLAICFAVERFHTYVYARHVTIETDHKPLIDIAKKPLALAPRRLQRMLLRLQFILVIFIAPLQVLYYSEALPTTARILYRSFTPRRTGN